MDYDGTDKVVSVFIADADTKPFAPVATDAIDLPAWLGGDAYLAFTAATGGSTNSHFVTALTVARPAPEPGTWLLLAAGLAALSLFSSRRRGWLRD